MHQIYISQNGEQHGPYTIEDLKRLLEAQTISRDDLYWYEGCDAWRPVAELPQFALRPPRMPAAAAGSYPHTPPSPVGTKKKGCMIVAAVIVGIGVLAIGGCFVAVISGGKNTADRSNRSTAGEAAAPAPSLPVPPEQQRLVELLESYSTKYRAASNQLQKSALRTERKKDIQQSVPNLAFTGWVGTLKKLETTSNGDAGIVIALPGSQITLKTWSGALFEIGSSTLIEQSSALYQRLAALAEGDQVSFDGEFFRDDEDALNEISVTEAGSMTAPELIVRFKDVRKLE